MRNMRAINRFGSKVDSAWRYPEPRHSLIVEPFAGGAGYSLLHYKRDVLLIDLDEDVIGVWQYLIETPSNDVARLPLIRPDQEVSELDCSAGGRLLISWCLNQTATPRRKMSSWAVFHENRACYWGPKRRKQAALIASRVKHWRAIVGDYREAPNTEATWFVDPPYVDGGSHYRHSKVDYEALASWCRERAGQVIVCERHGADWLPFQRLYSAPTARRFSKSRSRCVEAVWLSDEKPEQAALFPETA